jgi:hypothetical protein
MGRWLIRVSLMLTGLTVLTRLPGLVLGRMFNVDESYLAAMGLTIGRGGHLYLDAVDRKPPVLPWLYSLSQSLTGSEDLRPMRLMATLVIAATGVMVAMLVVRLGGSRGSAFAAGALLVVGTAAFLPADAQAANFELFALLPASAAVLLAVSARSSPSTTRTALSFAAAGSLVALAGMIKQPFFAMLAPVGWEIWRSRPRSRAALATVLGLAASILAIGSPFGLASVWRWAWFDTGDYLSGQIDLTRTAAMLGVVLGLFAVLHIPVLSSIWGNRSRLHRVDTVIWFWFAGALVAIVPGFRFIAHYFELLIPPLAVMTGLLLATPMPAPPDFTDSASATPGRRPTRHPAQRVVVASIAIALGCTVMSTMSFANAGQVTPELVSQIQAHSRTNDRILVWGALPETYWRAKRLPGDRFLSVGYLTGKWADRSHPPPNAELIEPFRSRWKIFNRDLRAHPPTVVVDTSTSGMDGWNHYGPGRYPFGAILASCYHDEGQTDGMTIWTLVDAACVRRLAN